MAVDGVGKNGSSRICVKNLPAYVNEDKLKDHFSAKWEVTDAKVMRTKDGQSRRFGFVGFRSEEEANSALKYFDKSFFGTCRLTCELARAIADTNAVRPWSRHSKGSSAYEKIHKVPSAAATEKKSSSSKRQGEETADPKLAEFLDVLQPRTKTKLWGNDTVVGKAEASVVTKEEQDAVFEDEGTDTDDQYQKDAVAEKPISNMEYLKNKVSKHWSDEEGSDDEQDTEIATRAENEEDEEELENENNGAAKPEEDKEDVKTDIQVAAEQESVADTGRIFVRNLAYTASEEDLSDLFGPYGELSEVHLVLDKETNRSKGFAYVLFSLPECAARAMKELDKSIFQGRLLHLLPARQLPPVPEKHKGSATFKQERESQRKKDEASGNTKAWNSLYMRPDTVAENVAKQYGISKREFLDPQAEDLAVRLALGETHVIAETKRALSNLGLDVKVLEDIASGKTDKIARSNHVLLVKDLPFTTTEGDLSKLFAVYGGLGRLILPPTKTIAIVEFLEPSEARKAFKSLAYRKFKHVPLYLEWAPEGLLHSRPIVKEENPPVSGNDRILTQDQLLADPEEDATQSRSVFVKNLNFKTTEASLRKHFESQLKQGSLRKVTIKSKPAKTGEKLLSMGFGFLEFDSVETAQHVCKTMQGTVLEEHALVLHLSRTDKKEKSKQPGDKVKNLSSTKIIVRNVAFEATAKDLKQLFRPFGQVKTLRLPRKFDGKHRGFAFVEFVTKQEAQNAFGALSSTHLYGRHLVLEWAREGETLEELRERTAAHFEGEEPASKKRRFS